MARIRTVKPEFFTSEDIVALSPLARLLYIATWCEADKAGRLPWKPKTFKLRYLPGDNCDVAELAQELVDSGLVVLYGDGLAYIPQFAKHQHINPRETDSTLPDPHASARVTHASGRVNSRIDPQGGREGKGREGEEALVPGKPETPPCPQSEIVEAYHAILPELPVMRSWPEDRQALLRTRWREDAERQTVDWWREFFGYVRNCPFLMGQAASDGRDPFLADLEWLIRPKNFRKVVEGKYEPRAA